MDKNSLGGPLTTVVYDARAIKPETRHWGPGVVVNRILPELANSLSIRGLSHSFSDQESLSMELDTWPSIPVLDKAIFEFSLLFTKEYDVYWGTNLFIPAVVRKPSVITVHDMLLFEQPEDQRAAKYFQNRFKSSVHRANVIVTDSKTSADSLIARFPEVSAKVEVGLLGYDGDEPEKKLVTQYREQYPKPYVIMLGAHRPRKQLNFAIEVVQAARATGVDIDLLVTGNVHESFREIVEKNKEFVHCPGVLEKPEVMALLYNAEALLFPTTYEGFGFPVLESMAMGCPVIASDIPIIQEISGGHACLVGSNPLEWAKSLKKIFTEKNYREELIESGTENLKRFSWESVGTQYRDIMTELAKNS